MFVVLFFFQRQGSPLVVGHAVKFQVVFGVLVVKGFLVVLPNANRFYITADIYHVVVLVSEQPPVGIFFALHQDVFQLPYVSDNTAVVSDNNPVSSGFADNRTVTIHFVASPLTAHKEERKREKNKYVFHSTVI